ncbi:MAG: CPBP family intramembrane glutamic endopeptidase [Pseudomonadota bacterium]
MFAGTPLLALAVAAALAAPAFADAARRAYAIALVAAFALYFGLTALPESWPGDRWLGDRWNWAGGLLATAGMLALAATLVRRAGFAWREFGFTWSQRPGSLRAALLVALPVLALNYAALTLSPFRLPGVPLETWLFQATVPGLAEEVAFRGVLLALADRAFAARRTIGGARLGWGGVVVTAGFVAAHGLSPGTAFGVAAAAVLYLWLRARTGSLVLPVVVHNLWNLSVYAAHL